MLKFVPASRVSSRCHTRRNRRYRRPALLPSLLLLALLLLALLLLALLLLDLLLRALLLLAHTSLNNRRILAFILTVVKVGCNLVKTVQFFVIVSFSLFLLFFEPQYG
jgi:hypothetical protein